MSDGVVNVAIRLRPPIEQETDESTTRWLVRGNTVVSSDPSTNIRGDNGFHFDHIFDTSTATSIIFDNIARPIVDAAVNGYNGTVFSYGQSNSGKTYTMIGTSEEPGIIPLAIKQIFKAISNTIGREFLLRISYLEIYDEKLNDLLSNNGTNLQLHKDESGQIIVKWTEEITNSAENMLFILKKGFKNKRIRENNRNECNSSHSIFRITIESQEVGGDSKSIIQISQLNLVELAGSERAHRIGTSEEQTIDVSLSTLGIIVMQLNESQNGHKYINYHNSKLTELLQTSLGGNSMTAIICTVIPIALEETCDTLSFALQAKNIKNWPQKNEIVSNTSLLIRYSKQLIRLQAELERIRNGNSCIEVEEVDSKLQEKYHISLLLEERIKLLKNQIVTGVITSHEEPFKCKTRRRQTWSNPGTIKHHLPVFHARTGLPTIKEMSPEKSYRRNSIHSADGIHQTFQIPFTDFELDLLESDTECETKENGISIEANSILNVNSQTDDHYLTPEKQDSSVQTLSNQISPSTPKNVLRKYISDLTKDLDELREFTTLEKQIMCQESHCLTPNLEEQLPKQCDVLNSRDNDIYEYSSNLIMQLEVEKAKLAEDLELKIQELSEIKNDIQGLKSDVEKLQKTIYLLTNENMEMSNKLSTEKERSKQAEINLQRTIDELYARISKVTDEKINLESDLMGLNDQLQSIRAKTPERYNDEQLLLKYQNKIDILKTENIELSAIITEKNKELESIKESKSLLYDHECMYKDKVILVTEKNACLITENNELSTDVMDKIEENEMLREQCEILRSKLPVAKNTNSDENDVEQLRLENNLLRAEVLELKMKVTMLSDENAKFSYNLLETMENLDNSRSEKLSSNMSSLISIVDSNTRVDESVKTMQEEHREELENQVVELKDKVNHLTRLNKKLSDLKLSSCSQCAHLKNLNESRRALKLEAKVLNHKLEDLQKKFDRKCADSEALRMKVNQDLNLSFADGSLNSSFADGMNVSFVEEKVQHLSNELLTLKNDRDKLSHMYREKCDELEKLHDEAEDTSKPKKRSSKNETRIEQIQNSIDQVRDDIDELKKNSVNFTSVLSKFRAEKASLLDEINILKNINEELQQKVSDNEMSAATATEKAQILENELLNMSKELEHCSIKEKEVRSEKLTLEVELEDLKAEKEIKDTQISRLHTTIDDLNECISSLKNELDLMTSQKDELAVSSQTIEIRYRDELELLKKQFEELEKEKEQSSEAEKRAILWAKELESDIEKLQTDLTKQESLYKEVQGKVCQLELLLDESENEKETLKQKLQTLESQLIDSKDNLEVKYKDEFESITKKFEEYTKESEMKLSKINETLNKYVDENGSLTQELVNLRAIELKFNKMTEENEEKVSVDSDNKKLKKELDTVRECMIKELKSLEYKVNSVNFLSKTANEIFIIFLQTLMSKEEEVIRTMREMFEKDKQKLEDEKRQSADSEKRVMLWAKEIETDVERLQVDLTKRENMYKEQQDKIFQLDHLLRESKYEKEILREKLETLEVDFNNLQTELDKQCNVDVRQEEVIIVAQKREKEAQETFRNKEIEFQGKMKSEKEKYEKRIEELLCTVEIYKSKNTELKNNIEGMEANENQLKNIIEANSTELKMNSQTIYRMNIDLEQLTEAYNEVNREVDKKTSKIEDITALLKSKCDMLSEYKAKLENIVPDYEILKDQVKERKSNIEKYKEEIEELKMEKEKQIELIKDKLNSEEIRSVGLNKQLNELNNKNVALVEELDGLKEKYEELQHANRKLERKIRNSTSKVKAEAEMEDLRDVNKRLQNNLEGASNRIVELQDSKKKILKELVNLKGQYESLSQETAEIKKTLALYKSRQSTPCLSQEDGRYDALLQEKNKIALELEGKKLLLSQRDKEIKEHVGRVRDLNVRNRELDVEVSHLTNKLYSRQMENKLVNELEERLRSLTEENEKLKGQIEKFKSKPQVDMKQLEDIKLYNEKVFQTLRKENSELQLKLGECENKLELKSNSSGSRSTSPAFEISRRRHSRSEIFNQRRQIDYMVCDIDINENEETCQVLRKKIQELELQLVSKNGQIATLEIQIQSENFPYQRKCKDLEELLLTFRNKNTQLGSEVRKLQRAMNDINAWECDTCRRWRINRREQACQTSSNNTPKLSSTDTELIDEHMKIVKLEKEKVLIKNVCRSQYRRLKEFEDKIRELEEAQGTSSLKPMELLQENSNQQYSTLPYFHNRFDLEKNVKPAMKENVPANLLQLAKPLNYRRDYTRNSYFRKEVSSRYTVQV